MLSKVQLLRLMLELKQFVRSLHIAVALRRLDVGHPSFMVSISKLFDIIHNVFTSTIQFNLFTCTDKDIIFVLFVLFSFDALLLANFNKRSAYFCSFQAVIL